MNAIWVVRIWIIIGGWRLDYGERKLEGLSLNYGWKGLVDGVGGDGGRELEWAFGLWWKGWWMAIGLWREGDWWVVELKS